MPDRWVCRRRMPPFAALSERVTRNERSKDVIGAVAFDTGHALSFLDPFVLSGRLIYDCGRSHAARPA